MDLFTDELEGDAKSTPSYASVQEGKKLLTEFDEAAPSRTWPSTVQHLHEIQVATDKEHGGPLTTPTLEYPRRATWDEIRARVAAEKAAAALPPPPTAPTVDEAAETPSEPTEAPSEVASA